jgi:hypothetical protein
MSAFAVIALAFALSTEQQEHFLRTAKITASKEAGKGITDSKRITLSDGETKHDAHLQRVDVFRTEARYSRKTELQFRDCWKYNVAAYRLAKLLGIDTVPATVERRDFGGSASVTWWVDDVMMDEAKRERDHIAPPDTKQWARQMERVRVFDQLIYNIDRNTGNIVITKDWKLWMIDHSRSFRRYETLPRPERIYTCERTMFERMQALNEEILNRELKPYLSGTEIRALLARRDEIVRIMNERRKQFGETVLFEIAPISLHANLTN